MKLSIICCLKDRKTDNNKTVTFLAEELKRYPCDVQLVLTHYKNDKKQLEDWKNRLSEVAETAIVDGSWKKYTQAYNMSAEYVRGDYVTVLHGGDCYDQKTLKHICRDIAADMTEDVYVIQKQLEDEKPGAFRSFRKFYAVNGHKHKILPRIVRFSLDTQFHCCPILFGGTIIRASLLKKDSFREDLIWDAERDFFLRLYLKVMHVAAINHKCMYHSWEYEEKNTTFYPGVYELSWYYGTFEEFWFPFLEELEKTYGTVPVFIQYHLMYSIIARLNANLNNKNKHIIEEGKGEEYIRFLAESFRYVDDRVLLNAELVAESNLSPRFKWVFELLKHGTDYKYQTFYSEELGEICYGIPGVVERPLSKLSTNIMFMEYENGKLEIDGNIDPILHSIADEVSFCVNGTTVPVTYNERYTITKAFGASLFRLKAFHISVPLETKGRTDFYCEARIGEDRIRVELRFDSHFSRLTDAFRNSYWCFGPRDNRMATVRNDVITVRNTCFAGRFLKECRLQFNMLCRCSRWIEKYAIFRILYFIVKPFMTKQPIWMYIDKIYKGGDSSEYLYRYACAQNDGIRHYYLVDKNATDYERLRKAGYEPLVRNSIKHKLIFLYADMMIISNSTVYAFNGYGLVASSLIRGLPHFHVCCVQHGMSVQKIAIAQNRLRDNTRLYFCASEYEIENLSRPVYDYVGYDALKLTGVPRYDGLHDRAEKQIMISPTWRMQAAVPVRTNEGEQRDYNPLFKKSTYYKVFNALINDERLIRAAKEYGYRIKYVLHPIVSSQVKDFDKNDYVDIVPAVGDMSYEDMFCESSLMVTDFSGIQFDFAYMRKPLVYLHHKDIPQHYEEGSFYYDTMAFGEICHDNDELIDVLIDYMKHDCVMKDEYRRRADDFFYYSDDHNCERIYQVMREYQKEKMGK